jgi:group I intron endonuclease
MKTGIYKIQNSTNNKIYIGSAVDIKKRWRDHKWCLIHNKHHNSHLQSSWIKYGADSFEFSIILECEINDLLTKELNYILQYDSFNNKFGYNVNDPEHTFLNRKHTEKTKQLLSKQKLGDKNPMYGKCGDKHPNFNKVVSTNTRNKMSLIKLGIPTNRQTNLKLNEIDVINIRKMYYEEKISQPNIASAFNVSYGAINKIITGKTWSHLLCC